MSCTFFDEKIVADKPECILVSKKPSVEHFCCLGCLAGHVDELAMEEEEKTGFEIGWDKKET
ncbi:hypothetical protein [Brevibacillus reuszeri]|uniref:hypothetical protein n=1 Tax=Brevibacillus reuszeri TaxID=54915 RepID=UPI00289E2AB2|nr:hypothetical protein [Brevibacillus reuszeri]